MTQTDLGILVSDQGGCSLIAELWFLPVHRYYIQTEILHFTIILHVSALLKSR